MDTYIDQQVGYGGKFGRPNNTYYGIGQTKPAGWASSDYTNESIVGCVNEILHHPLRRYFGSGLTAVIIECGDTSYRYTLAEHGDVNDERNERIVAEATRKARARDEHVDAIVAKGADWLDTFLIGTDWRHEIQRDTLEMASGSQCVLGQTAVLAKLGERYGDYSLFADHIRKLGITSSTDDVWFEDHGFYSSANDDDNDDEKVTYSELNAAWDRLLFSEVEA
jgi:cytochrome c1